MEQSPSSEAATQLVNKFRSFYGNRGFITVFTTGRLSSYPEPDQFSLHLPTVFL